MAKKIQVRRRGQTARSAKPTESAPSGHHPEPVQGHSPPVGNAGIMLNELAQGRKQFLDSIEFATTDDPRIQVHPELRRFIPRLVPAERVKLRNSLKAEGCRDAIILWRFQPDLWYIVDGHNRFELCEELDLEVPYRLMDFSGLDAVKNFMMDLQLGKRNLVKWQVSYYRGMKYLALKNTHGGSRVSSEQNVHLDEDGASEQNVHLKKVSEQLAEEFGVSHMTVQRDARFYLGVEALPSEVKERFMARSVKIRKQAVEFIGVNRKKLFEDEEAVREYLAGKIVLDEENADEETKVWIKDYAVKKVKQVNEPVKFDREVFFKNEWRRCQKLVHQEDTETLKQVLSVYEEMVDLLKKTIK
ncbi:MAG: hypothetical protein MI784_06605 [Cytophagales bacterium]|nr:hypothetical protein [Cytophagales bacterium]